jgi:fibronectin-binding autotransporter adhesin
LNFVGKFDAKLPDGTGAPYFAHTHVDAASAHAPSDAIIVPDAKLLFEGDFKRSGVDLILSKDGHETVVHDYFKGEKRVALSSPDGAHLTGDIVNALAGHVEYAQAGGGLAAAAAVVGHVTKLMGSATAIRNGVSIILNQGDNIEKGDVLQSGADSTLGVTFIDGTVFGLSSNARMVVNEMVYDPNGSSNSSLLSLVAGTISFVAGETAKHGDMKVDTPVATMGIRGTAVLVEIDFGVPGGNGAPAANFQVLVEPDGTTGSYILFDKSTLTPLATVNAAGTLTKISQGVVSFQSGTGLSPEEQKLITDVFQQKFTDNSNPKSDHQFTDSITPQGLTPIKLFDGLTATPVVVVVQGSGALTQASSLPSAGLGHIPLPPAIATFNELFNEHIGTTGSSAVDTVSGKINFADINAGDLPSVTAQFTSFTYQDAHQADITKALTAAELAAVKSVEPISLQTDPGNTNTGSATWTYSYPDGAFDFLGAGETLTLTYTATVNNNFLQNPQSALQTFTITITGTNDVPVITSSVPQTIAFNAGTSVPGGDLGTLVPTSGTIAFHDPDLTDTHTVSVNLLLNGLNLPPAPLQIFEKALTASIAADSTGTGFGTVNWKLADLPVYLGDFVPKGQTITLTYAVTVTDSQGATSTQDITVTITGTDTPAVVWIATSETGSAPGELLWSNASNWETGTVPTINDDAIVITNQLIGLTPSFPVTINAPAEAKSLTMNDFGTTPPEVINQSTLTLAGALNMAADSIIHNSGTISVGGLIEVLDTSVLDNSGTLVLKQGGDFSGQSIVTNTGSIEIAGGTLNVQVDVANSGQGEEAAGGQITIDSGAALALGAAAIIGGTVTNNGTLTLDIGTATGSSVLKNGTLNNNQALQAGNGAELQSESVTNAGAIEVLALGTLLLDQGTAVHNTSGIIAVDGTGMLTLNDASIDGGIINNFSSSEGGNVAGTIDVTGSSTISNAELNYGNVIVENGATLTLDHVTVTGATITDVKLPASSEGTLVLHDTTISGGTVNDGTSAAGGIVDVTGSSLISEADLNNGNVTVESGQTLTLDNDTVTGTTFAASGAIIQIDGGTTLKLDDVTIDGGTIDNYSTVSEAIVAGDIDVTGSSTLNNAHLNNGTVTIESGQTLTLDGDTVTGTIFTNLAAGSAIHVDGGDTLSLDDVTIGGGGFTVGVGALVTTHGDVALSNTVITNDGTIEIAGGTLTVTGPVASSAEQSGSIKIDTGAVLDLDASDTQNIVFNGAGAELKIDASSFGGSISGLAATDEIDLGTIGYGPGTTGTYIDGVLTITDGSHSISMTLSGDYSDAHFAGSSDGHGGTLITLNAADDAPVIASTDQAESVSITELANTTGSSAPDPMPAASGTVHFTDIDLTDRPTADVVLNVTWTEGTTDLSSSLTPTEINALESAFALSQSGNTNNGALGWSYQISDSALDFLGAGETAKVTATITLDDHQGGTDTSTVTIMLDGSNDAPVLAADTSGAGGTNLHTINELPGKTGDTADVDSASGTLSFTDVDLTDTHTVSHSGPTYVWSGGSLSPAQTNALAADVLALTETDSTHTGAGSISFSYSAVDSTLDFLGAGQTLTVTYDIAVTDGSGASSSQPVTFTITGTNDAPVIVCETDPVTQTVILAKSPIVLSAGTSTNALGLPTETFDEQGIAAGSISNHGAGHGSFYSDALDATFTSSGEAGVVLGSAQVTVAPFIGPLPGHADNTNYLSIGANGSETITFATEQNQFGLYWGSVDTYNTISFYDGSHLVASYSGAQIAPLLANGNQGSFSGNGYVEFPDLAPFTKVVLASGSNAFEVDNISAGDSHVELAGPITGTITVSDVDIGDTLTASVTGNAVAAYNGSTTLPSGINISALIASGAITFDSVKTTGGQDVLEWTYNPTNANLDFLQPGDKLTLTFNATVSDGHATTADQALTVTLVGNGGPFVNGTAHNDTFTNVGGGVTIFGDGGHDLYNFNAHFGSATIGDFDVNNDVIDISSSLFASTAAFLGSAVGSGANTVITDSAGDQITLDHVSAAQLEAHAGDIQLTIANGGSFEAGASTSENVVFEGSTGKLTLDTPSSFTGTISGFAGDGTLSGSDQIDLKGIDYNSHSFSENFNAATDTLSVTDGTHSAVLHFNGAYQAANFSFTTDNSGGTIVYDPPVIDSSAAKPAAVTATSNGFVFNFADHGHDASGAHSTTDTHLFDGQTFVNANGDPGKPHEDGDGHVASVPESMDAATIAAVKAQLHTHDFHFA